MLLPPAVNQYFVYTIKLSINTTHTLHSVGSVSAQLSNVLLTSQPEPASIPLEMLAVSAICETQFCSFSHYVAL